MSEYLNLANKLVRAKSTTPQADEACHRAAVSRAYYAAYCLARNFARGRGYLLKDHATVKNYFKNSRQRKKKQIGVDLERLRADRNDADYKDILSNPSAIASVSIARANKILRILSSL